MGSIVEGDQQLPGGCAGGLVAPEAGPVDGGPGPPRRPAPPAPQLTSAPFTWTIGLPWSIWATPVARIVHASRMFHGNETRAHGEAAGGQDATGRGDEPGGRWPLTPPRSRCRGSADRARPRPG